MPSKDELRAAAPSPGLYDAHYYGHADPPTANYRRYGEPHWSAPLAAWLVEHAQGPFLDAGAAFGHLTRDLNVRLARDLLAKFRHVDAVAIEWSPYATEHAVCGPAMMRADLRTIADLWIPEYFGTVTSLDVLEHFDPAQTIAVLRALDTVLAPEGWQIHLVGAAPAKGDSSGHWDDPTHRNHQPLRWYREQFVALGYRQDEPREELLNTHPAWSATDWCGRWLVYRKAATHDDG